MTADLINPVYPRHYEWRPEGGRPVPFAALEEAREHIQAFPHLEGKVFVVVIGAGGFAAPISEEWAYSRRQRKPDLWQEQEAAFEAAAPDLPGYRQVYALNGVASEPWVPVPGAASPLAGKCWWNTRRAGVVVYRLTTGHQAETPTGPLSAHYVSEHFFAPAT